MAQQIEIKERKEKNTGKSSSLWVVKERNVKLKNYFQTRTLIFFSETILVT